MIASLRHSIAATVAFGHRHLRSNLILAVMVAPISASAASKAELVEVRKIWDAGRHNAFTDLIRWQDRWWCTFREADDHVGGDGAIRILTSTGGAKWESAALLTEPRIDLRDPKLSVTPSGRLMLNCGGSVYEGKTLKGKQSRVAFSDDGRTWTAPRRFLHEGEWCWRVTWHKGSAYAAVYQSSGSSSTPGPEWLARIYRGTDGVNWELLTDLKIKGRPNEITLRFESGDRMIALVRREADDKMGYVGRAEPPYREWKWQVSNHRFGGQNFIQLPDGRWMVGTRDYTNIKPGSGGARTILAQLMPDGKLNTLVTFPSGGDTSYPGLVWHEGLLWFSYYASHEGKTSIYLAKVRL